MMTFCYEGATWEKLDELWAQAKDESKQDEILEAMSEGHNLPFMNAARMGHSEVLKWIFKKWKD